MTIIRREEKNGRHEKYLEIQVIPNYEFKKTKKYAYNLLDREEQEILRKISGLRSDIDRCEAILEELKNYHDGEVKFISQKPKRKPLCDRAIIEFPYKIIVRFKAHS